MQCAWNVRTMHAIAGILVGAGIEQVAQSQRFVGADLVATVGANRNRVATKATVCWSRRHWTNFLGSINAVDERITSRQQNRRQHASTRRARRVRHRQAFVDQRRIGCRHRTRKPATKLGNRHKWTPIWIFWLWLPNRIAYISVIDHFWLLSKVDRFGLCGFSMTLRQLDSIKR